MQHCVAPGYSFKTPVPEEIFIGDESVALSPDPDGSGYRYFSAAVGWVTVNDEELRRYRANVLQLLLLIQQLLEMSSRVGPACLCSDLVWDLGDKWFGKKRLAVLFLRRAHLASSIAELKATLLDFPRRRSAIVLCDTSPNRYGPLLPGEPLCIPMESLLKPNPQAVAKFDMGYITEILGHKQLNVEEKSPVWCSDDGSELHVHGERYAFTGLTHRLVIRQLYEAWLEGNSGLRTATVLENAESKSKSLSHVFRGYRQD